MEKKNIALLIVDVQRGFVTKKTAHIPASVEKLQYKYDTVFATRFVNLPGSPYRTLIHWDRMTPGTEDTNLAFTPKPGVAVLEKPVYTCVTDSFLETLRLKGIDEVHICGIDTDACVTKCAVDLFERGIKPVVLKDCCATTADEDLQEAALAILKRYIGEDQVR